MMRFVFTSRGITKHRPSTGPASAIAMAIAPAMAIVTGNDVATSKTQRRRRRRWRALPPAAGAITIRLWRGDCDLLATCNALCKCNNGRIPHDFARLLTTDLLRAMCVVHDGGGACYDFKIENVVCIFDLDGRVRVVGMSPQSKICTAPEKGTAGEAQAADMWALGVLVVALWNGMRPPWTHTRQQNDNGTPSAWSRASANPAKWAMACTICAGAPPAVSTLVSLMLEMIPGARVAARDACDLWRLLCEMDDAQE